VDREITLTSTLAIPAETNKASRAYPTEKATGFEAVLPIGVLLAMKNIGWNRR
jgi:hypothetical protein